MGKEENDARLTSVRQQHACDNNSASNCSETMSDEDANNNRLDSLGWRCQVPGAASALTTAATDQMTGAADRGRQAAAPTTSNQWPAATEPIDSDQNTTLSMNSFTDQQQLPPSYRTACQPQPEPQAQPQAGQTLDAQTLLSLASSSSSSSSFSASGNRFQRQQQQMTNSHSIGSFDRAAESRVAITATAAARENPQTQRWISVNLNSPPPQQQQQLRQMQRPDHLSRQVAAADNNRRNGPTAAFNGRPQMAQQQQPHQLCAAAAANGNSPINHVISAEASTAVQPPLHGRGGRAQPLQANQYNHCGSNNDYVPHQRLPSATSLPSGQIQNQSTVAPGATHRLESAASISNQSRASRPKTSSTTGTASARHRRRRRHRSASGRSGGAGEHARHENEQTNLPQSISAHCWLIDSSDDQQQQQQVSTAGRRAHERTRSPAGFGSLTGSGPLTVALMRQQQQEATTRTLDFKRRSEDRNHQLAAGTHSLLRMHRTTSHGHAPSTIRAQVSSGATQEQNSSVARKMRRPPSSPSPSPSSSSSAASNSSSASSGVCRRRSRSRSRSRGRRRETENSGGNASVILRLSAILSMASRLVRKQPQRAENLSRREPSHISGSSSAPYTGAGSLAIGSSSSSTSAYATGSQSSQSQQQQQRLLQLNVINQQHQSMSTFYGPASSSLGPSIGPLTTAGSSHAYEYCDSIDLVQPINETKFVVAAVCQQAAKLSANSSSESSNSSSSTMESAGSHAPTEQERPLPTQSDHELISAGSLDRNDPDPAGFHLLAHRPVLPQGVARLTHPKAKPPAGSSARRRWWWLNFKQNLRRPRENSNHHLPTSLAEAQGIIPSQQQTAQATVASYKSLRSASQRRPTQLTTNRALTAGRSSRRRQSTLSNVISLAKADRAFRLRLLASILVSCVLLALICLLAVVVYSRGSTSILLQSSRRLNLLVDDSDYDLSWLWPQPQKQQQTDLPRQLVELESQMQSHQRAPLAGSSEVVLGRHLLMIDRSERLEQFQLTLAHLTNIQLAGDNFIDIVQLIESSANSTARDAEDLVYVTLLSNLHWPLVKWRHQNQQSVASFLSAFSTSSSSSSSSTSSQNLRNLLSLLLLAEAQQTGASASEATLMKQIIRLNNLLRNVSAQLISCSAHGPVEAVLREKFCHRLTHKYRQLMLVLSQLNHSHLARLQSPASIELLRRAPTGGNTYQGRAGANTKTLIGFLSDRLALLDVQLIAEELVAAEASLEKLTPLDVAAPGGGDEATKRLIDQVILAGRPLDSFAGEPQQLYELARTFVGDSAASLNINLVRNKELQAKLQQLELDNQQRWHQVVSRAILLPWSVRELPEFVLNLADYDLFIHANLSTRFVQGMVKIEFKIKRPTRFLVLNSVALNLADITLWQKQLEPPYQQRNRSSNADDQHESSHLREVPLRRVLLNTYQEQVHIEVQDQLESHTIWTSGAGQQQNAADSLIGGVNFGDLSISLSNGRLAQSQSSMRSENVYVLSIAFNKTSLSRPIPQSDVRQSINNPNRAEEGQEEEEEDDDEGLKFVHYGDYFAQQQTSAAADPTLAAAATAASESSTAATGLKTMLYTRFEPANARHIFPCFDEPKFRAQFQLNLVHQANHQVISNAQKRERIPYTSDGALQMSVFEAPSPSNGASGMPLSTCMVSFMIFDSNNIKSVASRIPQQAGNFSGTGTGSSNQQQQKHIQIQILAQFEHLGQTEFAASLAPQLLTSYQSFLQFAYPFEKLDLVAVPSTSDDDDGQDDDTEMESLGLIAFRSAHLLVDTNLISQDLIEQTSLRLAHQLAHQYFGNIITIPKHSDSFVWLYEALCKYLESLALSRVQTDWRLEEQFPVSSIQETLDSAATESSVQVGGGDPLDLLQSSTAAAASREQTTIQESPQQQQQQHLDEIQNSDFWLDQDDPSATTPIPAAEDERGTTTTKLNRNSAILHMLLFNLLPGQEAQGRLLRACLSQYSARTMSSAQFWRQFGLQLQQDSSFDRLALDVSKLLASNRSAGPQSAALTTSSPDEQTNERIVFVKGRAKQQHQQQHQRAGDLEEVSPPMEVQSERLADNMDLVAGMWMERDGFPLISVTAYRDHIHLKQERFSPNWWLTSNLSAANLDAEAAADLFADGFTQANPDRQQQDEWWLPIPLMFVSRYNSKLARFFWMASKEMDIPFGEHLSSAPMDAPLANRQSWSSGEETKRLLAPRPGWLKLNANQSSLVRVNYDERIWDSLGDLLIKSHYSNHILNPLDRANLIDDALTLMRCGRLSVGVGMNLTLYLEVGERDYMPWTMALKHLDQMQTLLNQNPLWHRYVLKLLQPISSIIGWKDDGPHLMRKLRRKLFSVALQYGDEKSIGKAKQEFKAWSKNGRFIVPNLQELVYVAGVRYGDQQEWFHCWQRYQQLAGSSLQHSIHGPVYSSSDSVVDSHKRLVAPFGMDSGNSAAGGPVGDSMGGTAEANLESEKHQLLTALASTQNTWLIEQFLNYSLDASKIERAHLKHIIQVLGKNPVARLYLWRFVRLNWYNLFEAYSSNQQHSGRHKILETMVIESTRHFATKLDYDEVKTFFDAKRKSSSSKWSKSLELAVGQSLRIIQSNIYWRNIVEPKLTNWLSHFGSR